MRSAAVSFHSKTVEASQNRMPNVEPKNAVNSASGPQEPILSDPSAPRNPAAATLAGPSRSVPTLRHVVHRTEPRQIASQKHTTKTAEPQVARLHPFARPQCESQPLQVIADRRHAV